MDVGLALADGFDGGEHDDRYEDHGPERDAHYLAGAERETRQLIPDTAGQCHRAENGGADVDAVPDFQRSGGLAFGVEAAEELSLPPDEGWVRQRTIAHGPAGEVPHGV